MSETRPASPHPFVFLVLCTPFGAANGYLTVTLGYLLHKAGVGVEPIAGLVAVSLIPQTWKFLWAPVVDTTMSSKLWYFLSAIACALTIAAVGFVVPSMRTLPFITTLIFLNSLATTFLAMAAENIMAHSTGEADKGRAGGWYQAGNLGGQGVGGGVALLIAQHSGISWLPGIAMAVLFMSCCLGLLFVANPPNDHRNANYLKSLGNVALDVWNIVISRAGFLAVLICFLPIGAGAASNLWSSISGDWHAGPDTVAMVNGMMGGLTSAVGCVVGGYLCDRMERKFAYALFGVFLSAGAIAMALTARTQAMFIGFTLLYAFIQGLNYSSFTAVVLEAIGRGAAATKYNICASLSNMPIMYMTYIEGIAYERWHSNGLLWTDALSGAIGVAFFAFVAAVVWPQREAVAAA